VHVTAGFGDLGFSGHWTLEMTVIKPLRIYAGMQVAQVIFVLPLSDTQKSYARKGDAKYQNQGAYPMPSAMWKNFVRVEQMV
jgi:dCTP deaminase